MVELMKEKFKEKRWRIQVYGEINSVNKLERQKLLDIYNPQNKNDYNSFQRLEPKNLLDSIYGRDFLISVVNTVFPTMAIFYKEKFWINLTAGFSMFLYNYIIFGLLIEPMEYH